MIQLYIHIRSFHSSILACRIPMETEAWWAPVHGVPESWTWLSNRAHTFFFIFFPLWFVTRYWMWLPVLYSRILLFIHSIYKSLHLLTPTSLLAQLVKNPPAMWETWVQSLGSIPVLGRSSGEGKDYPVQYSGPENSMDCIVHRVTKSWTWLRDSLSLSIPASTPTLP